MTLNSGQRLLQYELIEKIGEGGMGVVWKAIDTTLDREAAIKVLPAAFADDTERLARFEREAKLLASLDHPNLATIFGVHEAEGVRFLAMELVPGEDLAQRLSRGRLPVGESIGIATQIAEALESAHAQGVVHRDLKPANIKLTPGGQVKVLDFGLAKAIASRGPGSADPALSPTMTSVGSAAGVLLGTAPYMSPEQARGHGTDARSDIWSFGCVLWECLTGKTLFGGTSVTDSLGSILHVEPDWQRLPAETPPGVRRLLRRCLVKEARNRLHHIADARIELAADDPASPAVGGSPRLSRVAAIVLAVALIAALAVLLPPFLRPAVEPEGRSDANPLSGARFSRITDFDGTEFDAAISPDGRFVAFVSNRDGAFEIYVGQVGTTGFRKLTSYADEFTVDDALAPVRSVGFNSDGSEIWLGGGPWRRVRSLPLLGGQFRNFLSEDAVNVAWSPDGRRIVYHERTAGDPLYVADRDDTNARKILAPPAGTHQHYPVWATDGEWIYLVRGRPSTLEMDLWRVRPDGEQLQRLTQRKLDVRYPTPIDENTVLYSALDSDGAGPWLWSLDVPTGESRRASVGLEHYASVAASADGLRLVATVPDSEAGLWSVPILDRPASESDVRPFADLPTSRALSPRFAGSSLLFLSSQGSGDGLWRHEGGTLTEIWRGSETALLEPAAVAPDGEQIALLLRRDEGWRLFAMKTDGTGLKRVTDQVDARGSADWSPDGRWIVSGGYEDGVEGLYKIPLAGGAPQRLVEGEALNPVWSPKGDLIVYTGAQVNIVSPLLAVRPDGTPVELPKIDVFRWGERMRFLPDGSGLVFMRGYGPAQDFWLLNLETMEERRLTELDGADTMLTFDITPDGTQIVFDRLVEESDVVLIERVRDR